MRRTLFWLHLVAGLIAGLVIAMLCFTGVVLAFEKQIIAFVGRETATASVPADPVRLSLDELASRARAAQPEARLTAITVRPDPAAAVTFAFGRETTLLADPSTGELRPPGAARTRAFMHFMTNLHRTLSLRAETTRPVGKAITGAANVAFLVLALTGLYLWWPRSWSWRGLKAIATLNLRLRGKARDWNWHNTLGLWSAPVLIILTLTALPISYRWANNLLYTLTGSAPPAQSSGPGAQPPGPAVPQPLPSARPLPLEALLAAARAAAPGWTEITLRLGGGREAGPRREPGATGPRRQSSDAVATPPNAAASPSTTASPSASAADSPRPRGPEAMAVAIRTADQSPRFATTTLHLDPFTGAVLRTDTFAGQSAGRRLRSWSRYLHTGEALGWPGQLVAAIASAAALFLVWTGFALSWRRFFRR
ncbi:MAG: PepSY domain-containing protein [Opitutaceae bacterium]|nr:PepSY domain-containing protein [Opitutaceae bacterium]